MKINEQELIKYYKDHSMKACMDKFSLSKYKINKILLTHDVILHTQEHNRKLYELEYGNAYANSVKRKFQLLANSIDKEEFERFYHKNGADYTCEKYSITKGTLNKLINHFNIRKLTGQETKEINYIKKYGSYEKGKEIQYAKVKKYYNDNKERIEKQRSMTNLARYGSISPFGNVDVQAKAKNTFIEKYGVDNPFKNKEIQDRIHTNQRNKYGGIGWSSEEIRTKYNETMQERYGVEWGCMTDQCKESNRGSNSESNLAFLQRLNEKNLQYSTEYVLDNFRYDFKVGNRLIEINPTATHNSSWGPFGTHEGIATDYHYNKSRVAREHRFQCIHIWDWDDIDKIVSLLEERPTVYARKCEIKHVTNEEAKKYINEYHLQGYAKAKINIGLYYNHELVSIMTFGKPRYSKKYEYELIRYCSSYNVIGGAERLFKNFIREYKPNFIISYCDLIKFTGNTYEKLGFTELRTSIGKHWCDLRGTRHITDNLLRQQGFDRLFNTNYGKGTSNEELIREQGFLDVYDAGQRTYVYTK